MRAAPSASPSASATCCACAPCRVQSPRPMSRSAKSSAIRGWPVTGSRPMARNKSLLVELGTEELPPRSLDALGAAFLRDLSGALAKAGVHAGLDDARAYVTPRRLAVYIPDVAAMQPAQTLERRGPALAAGLDAAGPPTPALLG